MELQFNPDNPDYEYIVDQKRAEEVLEKLAKEKVIAVDIEGSGLDPYTSSLFLIQLGTATKSFLFDAREINFDALPLYKKIMEDDSKVKLLQNAKFDYSFLKIHTNVEIKNLFDTMLAEGILTSGLNLPLSLKDISDRYIRQGILDKSLQKSFITLRPKAKLAKEQLAYAANDTLVLFPIFDEQIKKLHKEDLLKIAKLEFAVTPVVSGMELKGVLIDTKKWREILKELIHKRNELAKEFQESIRNYYNASQFDLFGGKADSVNINSSVQLMDLFNNKLGLDLPSTSDGVLSRVNHPIVNILRNYRGYEKLISTYGEKLLEKINKKTGRIHPEFLQIRTATGRFACNNPNLQNIPRNSKEAPFRECFNPAKGYKLVVSDYSSFEMRILAELSGDEKMIKALNEGLDIHSYTAALMFDKPYSEDFKKLYPDLRQIAKPIGFGLMYGMGAPGLVSQIFLQTGKEISVSEGEDLINRYFASYPGVKRFLENSARDAVKKGWSTTPAGRKRWYTKPDPSDPDYRRKISSIEREAKNHPIQGTNADAIKYALVFINNKIKKENYDAAIVSTVHDEIVCEVREDQAQKFSEMLSGEMIKAGELFLKKVKVESVPFIGDVWEH
ncbi:hypothetical protein A2V49_03695 [candidate division WWE3 bacterium RBG_19FT_COMBO_34_6]|uniref:DNA polymerase I n=1 Tax=candidate division WWE3 bacterium RBG_19FT_COMBO_34_6 TaxID=1802612 RepID=A0A1F4UKZ2_UNCKA|nr:MAG: hypothetical protein A2V49_03695 [candidate division WWE3 bacterium RBG_19FT_COMBO_34_6]